MECPLHPAELRVMRMILDGFEVPEVAARLGVTEKTVYNQARAARETLGAPTNIAAGAVLIREGWHTFSRRDDLGRDVDLSPWALAYLLEFGRFLLGPVRCRDEARSRASLALLGMGWRAGRTERDRLPRRLAWVLGLHESTLWRRRILIPRQRKPKECS